MFYGGFPTVNVLPGISYRGCSTGDVLPGMFYGGFPTVNVLPGISYRGCSTGDVLPGMFYRGFPTGDFLQRIFYRGCSTEDVLQRMFYRGCSTGDVLRGTFYADGSTESNDCKNVALALVPISNFTQNRSEVISKYSIPSTQMGTSSLYDILPSRHPPAPPASAAPAVGITFFHKPKGQVT
jgi:hypothetical protein